MLGSNKSLLFLLGLVLGLLAGAGFFIFKMDNLMKNINLFSASRDTIVIRQQPDPVDVKAKADVKKYIGQRDTTKKNMTSAELLAKKYSREVSSRRVMAEADSLLRDSSELDHQNRGENFIVRKDELPDSKNLQVVNLQNEEAPSPSDSLLEKVSGIKKSKNSFSSLKVEFWQSPINYKGYKVTKNKIILFGINSEENIKLFHLDDGVFMKHNQNYYKLYFTDDFKQFEKVIDVSIMVKLK